MNQKLLSYYEKYMYVIGFFGHSIFILQAYKIFQTQSAGDVSLEGFLISGISVTSWLIYGFLKKDKVLFLVNTFGLAAALTCIIAIITFR
jgi:uncharacterized protein with PQ loop repeat